MWLFCHLNWPHLDQKGLHFRAKQSIRHRNFPRSCHSVCSLHVPHKRFPVEAEIVFIEEVCVAILPRKPLNLPIKPRRTHNCPLWQMPRWRIIVESEREFWEFTKFELFDVLSHWWREIHQGVMLSLMKDDADRVNRQGRINQHS